MPAPLDSGSWTLAIDFGTSYTTIAARASDRVDTIELDGDRRIPSVVLLADDGSLIVGKAADLSLIHI